MFVERSEARVRAARTAFVLLCLLPCAGLAAWAAYRASDSHRRSLESAWGRGLGLEVRCDGIVHLRPGCLRIGTLSIRAPDGSVAATIDGVEIETTPDETRVRLPFLHATPTVAGVLGRLGRSWLVEPARHGRSWLVDVGSVRWAGDGLAEPPWAGRDLSGPVVDDRGFRVECVVSGGRRAIRMRREPATDGELRIVRTVEDGHVRTTVEGGVHRAVPTACVAAAMGIESATTGSAIDGWCSGTVEAESAPDAWTGRIDGCLERFSASSIVGLLGSSFRLDGVARVDLDDAKFENGRLVEAGGTVAIERGLASQELLDRLIRVAQCRAGEAYRFGAGSTVSLGDRPFDRVSCRMGLDRGGLTLRATEEERGIVSVGGRALLDGPVDRIEPERLFWAFAPRDARPLPATPATAWLERLLPAAPPPTLR